MAGSENDTAALPQAATLGEVLGHWGDRQPAHTVLISPETGRTVSYRELAVFAARLAGWYRQRDVAAGDRVAFYLPNGLAMSALFLATMAGGRVVTPVNLLSQGTQLAYVLKHCDARLLFTTAELSSAARQALGAGQARVSVEIVDPDALPALGDVGSADGLALDAAGAADIALMMYTSGTTGLPKAPLLSHRNLLHAARHVAAWHRLAPDDRVLSALPLYHVNGQVIATVSPFLAGGSMVVPRRFSVSSWWQQVAEHRCTWLNMVPTIIAYLLNDTATGASIAAARSACAQVRFGRSASAPLPPEHHRLFEERFGVPLIEAMGMTESASVVFCNPMPPAARKYGTPGVPLGIEARVVDREGRELPNAERGEIWFRGDNVMSGYYKSPQQTADALTADGWLRTGDLGHRDDDGFYFITGRLKELIIKGGENIAPREIDEALLRHPAVLEAAAVGVPHPGYGQDILACVVLREGAVCDEAALRDFCRGELGSFKTPATIRFVADLPKGPSGKVQRMKLLDGA